MDKAFFSVTENLDSKKFNRLGNKSEVRVIAGHSKIRPIA